MDYHVEELKQRMSDIEKAYDEYFTKCETANKRPLPFDQWKEKRDNE